MEFGNGVKDDTRKAFGKTALACISVVLSSIDSPQFDCSFLLYKGDLAGLMFLFFSARLEPSTSVPINYITPCLC